MPTQCKPAAACCTHTFDINCTHHCTEFCCFKHASVPACCLQVTSNEVSARVAQAEATEKEIDDTREQYRPVAVRASLLFFAISELAAVEPMYQYSLGWFLGLFVRAIEEAPKVRPHLHDCMLLG